MTNRFTGRREETKRRMIEAIPLGRMCSPDEIGKGVLWLCTDAAALMVGQTLNLDGGWANVKS
jgi:NAD(P)-dependent dehydrogenase (short-subunit alcohol dehydrogenase family)